MLSNKKADFTEGKLFLPIFLYTLPIIATGVLQLLYNMADQVVVGRFSGDPNALAAVGSTASTASLFTFFFMGLTAGTSVLVAQMLGAKNDEEVEKAVHTSVAFGLAVGVLLGVLAFVLARPLLLLLGTKEELLASATLYVKILALGIPFSALYNFSAAILRAAGDSRTPLIILAATGLLNVLLNLLFVIVFDMSVAGVALATSCAHLASAAWVLAALSKGNAACRFCFRQAKIHRSSLLRILRVGVPSAVQGCLFPATSMFIQSAVNTFPTAAIAGFTVSGTIEGFTYTAMNSYYQAIVTFTGQNYGAKKRERLSKVFSYTVIQTVAAGLILGWLTLLLAEPLSALFVDASESNAVAIIDASVEKMRIILSVYFTCGLAEILPGYLRGIGRSLLPMLCSILGICVFRIVWVLWIFPLLPYSALSLFISYPISWTAVTLMNACAILFVQRKLKKEMVA